ncbi:MAG: hypothetical protein RR295_03100, partial [Oscillospiraceae bacterium]
MKANLKHRTLSLIMALVMILGLLPMSALAEGEPAPDTTEIVETTGEAGTESETPDTDASTDATTDTDASTDTTGDASTDTTGDA